MTELRVSIVPVGRLDRVELDHALARVAKVLSRPLEVREPAPLPRTTEDVARGQHQAKQLLAHLRTGFAGLKASRLVGAGIPAGGAPAAMLSPDAVIFVTDVDLFTPATESVLAEVDGAHHAGLVSLRRLREAFYRRKADPAKQRARLAKEMLRAVGRARNLPDCGDPTCAMAATQALADLDRKGERYCGTCWKRLTTGAVRI